MSTKDISGTAPTGKAITGYHAHVYYAAATKATARDLRDAIAAQFPDLVIGRWHDEPVGPHPTGSYLVTFSTPRFANMVPWLMLHRRGLVVLVHPETGNDLADHTEHAIWMGGMPDLDVSAFEAANE